VSQVLRNKIRRLMFRIAAAAFLSALSLATLAYGVDYVVFRYRVSGNRQPFGQVTVFPYDAIPQKSGKTQFIFNPPEARTCVHALFPRAGYEPCWYLQRHTEQRTDL
jgi:hypothetical protein